MFFLHNWEKKVTHAHSERENGRESDGEKEGWGGTDSRHKHSQRHGHSHTCICSLISDTNSLINYIALVSGKNSSTRNKWKLSHFEALCMLCKCCPKLQTQHRSPISLWKNFYCNDFIRKKKCFQKFSTSQYIFHKIVVLVDIYWIKPFICAEKTGEHLCRHLC